MNGRVGVVGAGRLGVTAVQLVLSGGGAPTVLVRSGGGRVDLARERAGAQLEREQRGGRMTPGQVRDAWSALRVTDRPADLAGCRWVFECVPEVVEAKREALAAVEPHLPADAVVASTTSSIPAAVIGARADRPGRVCVAHLVWPAHRTRFAEVALPEVVDDDVPAALSMLLDELAVTRLVVRDAPGFLITRLLLGYWAAALDLVAGGASPIDVDAAMEAEGLAMGPLRLLDATGFATTARAARAVVPFDPVAAPLLLLERLVGSGVVGAGGRGFYRRGRDGRVLDEGAVALLRAVWPPVAAVDGATPPSRLADRAVAGLLAAGERCIAERVVTGWDDVALGAQRAYGFPASAGGVVGRWPAPPTTGRYGPPSGSRAEEVA